MSQTVDTILSKRTRRRGKWKQNWVRKNSGNLAKKQKLIDNAEGDAIKTTPPAVVGSTSHVDKLGLSSQPKRKYSDPLHLWRKTYENLLKWQTSHQLSYWKNNSRNLQKENMKLKEDICTLRAQTMVQASKNKNTDDEVIELENEEAPLECSSESETVCISPTKSEENIKFIQFLKATAAYNRKKK